MGAAAPRLAEYIDRDPAMHGGRPTIRGTRVDVATIVRYHRGLGYSAARIARALPTLSVAQVHAALAYYYDHAGDIDREIGRQDARVAKEMRRPSAMRRPRRSVR